MKRRAQIFGSDGETLLGTVTVVDGVAEVIAADARVRRMLVRLFDADFDERVGLPPKRVRAPKHSDAAFDAATEFIDRHLGLRVTEIPADNASGTDSSTEAIPGTSFIAYVLDATGFAEFDPNSEPGWSWESVSIEPTTRELIFSSQSHVNAECVYTWSAGVPTAEQFPPVDATTACTYASLNAFRPSKLPIAREKAVPVPARTNGCGSNTSIIVMRQKVAA